MTTAQRTASKALNLLSISLLTLLMAAPCASSSAPPPAETPYQKAFIEGTPNVEIIHREGPYAKDLVGVVTRTVQFYVQLFGNLPFDTLNVVEHQSMPFITQGLVFLPTVKGEQGAEADSLLSATTRAVIAEALARQWWGSAVEIADSDAVVREGLVQYAALLFAYQDTDDPSPLFTALEAAGVTLLSAMSSDVPLADVAAAQGLWVFHMLRNLMIDQNTMSDQAYQTTIRSFYHRYKRRTATAEDLQADAETVLGIDMQWFFDQWVHQVSIPIYRWAWKSSPGLDGRYTNTIRVRQTNVADGFQMYIPIRVVFEDGTTSRYRVKMVGNEATMDLPQTDRPITQIVFNEFAAVLCAAEQESP